MQIEKNKVWIGGMQFWKSTSVISLPDVCMSLGECMQIYESWSMIAKIYWYIKYEKEENKRQKTDLDFV